MNCFHDQTLVLLLILLSLLAALAGQPREVYAGDVEGTGEARYLSLGESLRLAGKHSLTLKMDQRKLHSARLNADTVALDKVPDLLVGASYQYEEQDDGQGELLPFVSLSRVVFNDASSYHSHLEAMNRLVEAEVRRETSLMRVYSDVIRKYFELLDAQNRLVNREETLRQLNLSLAKAQESSKEGLRSNAELMQQQAVTELAGIELEGKRSELQYLGHELRYLLHLQGEGEIIAADRFQPVFYSLSFDQCVHYARRNNRILALNRQVLERLPSLRSSARRTRWPSLSLDAYIGGGATRWDDDNRYGFALTTTWPLLDFGKSARRLQMIDLELDNIADGVSAGEEQYFAGLRLLYFQFVNAGRALQRLQEQQALSRNLLAATRSSFAEGVISARKMEQQETRAREGRQEYQSAVYRYLASEMLLKLNSGVADIPLLVSQGADWIRSEGQGDQQAQPEAAEVTQ